MCFEVSQPTYDFTHPEEKGPRIVTGKQGRGRGRLPSRKARSWGRGRNKKTDVMQMAALPLEKIKSSLTGKGRKASEQRPVPILLGGEASSGAESSHLALLRNYGSGNLFDVTGRESGHFPPQ